MVAGPLLSGYDTYDHDSFYDEDPSRSVSSGMKAVHVTNSVVFNAVGSLAGAAGGAYAGAGIGAFFGGIPGGAIGAVAGGIGGGYSGGSFGSRAAIEVNYSIF